MNVTVIRIQAITFMGYLDQILHRGGLSGPSLRRTFTTLTVSPDIKREGKRKGKKRREREKKERRRG
ncbi:hypothetical protein HOLleu_14435 [Holothuria leucospilota]|uniref:Uncharacterized protein n=1 Tax=Holothuria leucospilota TaxID=206669 RepID=A0A9Q1C8Z2_HOLLE|nr:hypothetical protein HOLleu_14435 [Holothuria leucospilota]